jgi:5-methyltetrahydropteroyltriglutamate--homocysteine methyltransferase
VEGYWAGRTSATELAETAKAIRTQTWTELAAAGLGSVPGNTFLYYDQVLDAALVVGAVPERFAGLGLAPIDILFTMARGTEGVPALELTKFFDTNYHYLVPELGPDTRFTLADRKPIDEFTEALELGVRTRPVLIGPVSLLLLAKAGAGAPAGFRPRELLEPLLARYAELLVELGKAGAEWVQLDEPAFVADRDDADLATYRTAWAAATRLVTAKEAVNRAFETSLAEGVRFERRLFHATFATADQKEGMAAFLEKRPPVFRRD